MVWLAFSALVFALAVACFMAWVEREEAQRLRKDNRVLFETCQSLLKQLAVARHATIPGEQKEPFRSEVVDENGLHFEGGDPRTPRTPEELGSAILEERLRVEERIHDLDERIGVGDG